MGGGGAKPAEGNAPDAAEVERQRHELENMQGRVKALDKRNKELEKQLAELRAARRGEDILSETLTAEEREKLDPAYLAVQAKIAAASEERIRREYEERERERKEQDARKAAEDEERAKGNFVNSVEERFPGFLASTASGGQNNEQWKKFYALYGPSISAAYNSCNLEAMAHFITQFQSQLGIRVPSGSQGTATSPDPRNLGSGEPVQHGGPNKVYTANEYAALEKQAMQLRRRGDWEGYRKLNDELNNILAENRVKD